MTAGSGKTFTITGGPERYADRGLIPRVISKLFASFQADKSASYTIFVSYLELYNESGYDLLAAEDMEVSRLEHLPKVTMLEDEDGNYHFRNLSVNPCASEEDALNLLFLGDTNRAIGETEMNQSSSRSHCIFSLLVEKRPHSTDTVVRSKLNLVDLAGSERVHKTNSSGQTLKEAQYINTSLFFLEMVIIALHEKTKKGKEQTHIPYRNSMMTSVLRDSLGGNCKTLMIAAVSPEPAQIAETISTCQFAQRVALVKNAAYINEELEPELVIARLKGELKRLREEIKFLKGENGEEDELSNEELSDLKQIVESYTSRQDDADLNIGRITLTKVKTVFTIFKELFGSRSSAIDNTPKDGTGSDCHDCSELKERLISLQRTLQQRDEEIKILVNMVKKGEGGDVSKFQNREGASSNAGEYSSSKVTEKTTGEGSSDVGYAPRSNQATKAKTTVAGVPKCTDEEILNDPQKALEWFKKQANIDLDADKALLENKINTAKNIGTEVKETKANIVHLKNCVDEIQRQVKVQEITGEKSNADSFNITHYLEEMEISKNRYKKSMEDLRELKAAIEHIKKLMERKRRKMQIDFDEWYGAMYANLEESKRYDKSESSNEASPTSSPKPMIKLPPGVKLTGNKEADEDIIAFYQAKEALFARTKYKL